MAKYINPSESIECLSAQITARRFTQGAVLSVNSFGLCFKYKTDRNSWATNQTELHPKQARVRKESRLDQGDILEADSFQLFYNSVLPLTLSLVNASGQHKASEATTQSFTFVQIVVPFEWLMRKLAKTGAVSQPITKLEDIKPLSK